MDKSLKVGDRWLFRYESYEFIGTIVELGIADCLVEHECDVGPAEAMVIPGSKYIRKAKKRYLWLSSRNIKGKLVKDTKIARLVYKNTLIEEKDGYLYVK